MDIVLYTFLQLLRSGSFGLSARVRPLSPYKWKKVVELTCLHDVADLIWKGVQRQSAIPTMNIPGPQRDEIAKRAGVKRLSMADHYPLSTATLPGKRANQRLGTIKDESHSKDVTRETLLIFSLLTHNTERMLNTGFHLRGLIDLGVALRAIGDKVDYVLIDKWLDQTSMRRMAQLQASILMDLFDFDADEFPFMRRKEKNAGLLAVKCIPNIQMLSNPGDENAEGYMNDNKRRLSKGIHRMNIYFRYSPSGSFKSMLNSMADGLSQIEE